MSGTGSKQAQALAATMRKGMAGLTSAHVVVDAGALGGKSVGDVSYSGGQATASDITLNAGGKARIVTVGGTSYAMLPPGRNTTGKPWVVVSPTSSNEFVRALSSQVTISKAASSLPAIADVVANAAAVSDKGQVSAGHHYAMQVDPAKVGDATLGSMLRDLGENPVPVQLVLDKTGRPVLIKIAVALGTQNFAIVITVSRFNAPLHISAPPSSQVTGG